MKRVVYRKPSPDYPDSLRIADKVLADAVPVDLTDDEALELAKSLFAEHVFEVPAG